jgi:hypothetical protein
MTRPSLDYDLIRIAADLKDAFENASMRSPELKSQLVKGMNTHSDLFTDFQKKEKIFMAKAMPMAFTHSEEEVIEDSFDEALDMLEAFCAFALKATSVKALRDFSECAHHTPRISQGYKNNNAPHLSQIYSPA